MNITMKTKIISILALLLTVTQGAWAQTNADKGRILAADGKMYKNVTLANKVSSARAVVAYVGDVAHYWDHCLCLALVDASGPCNWEGAKTAAQSWAASNSITLGSTTYATSHTSWDWASDDTEASCQTRTEGIGYGWRIPNVTDWRYIMAAYGGPSATSPVGVAKGVYGPTVRSAINTACGNSGLSNVAYWTCSTLTGSDPAEKWGVHFQNANDKDVFWTYGLSELPNLRLVFAPDRALTNGYVVEYDANGGSGAPAAQSKTHGTALTLSSTVPTRTGYTFAGWATSAEGEAAYSAGGSYTTDNDIVLYAKWTANTYSVHFNGNGSTSGSMDNESFTYDEAKALTTNAFSRTGYTFDGWATSADGAVAYTDGQSVSNLTAENGATFELFAHWSSNTATSGIDWNPSTKSGTFLMPAYNVEVSTELWYLVNEEKTLYENITAYGMKSDFFLNRTLKANVWNTFASPFAIAAGDMTKYFGTGAKVRQLNTTSVDGTVLTLNFTDADEIEAGQPYLVKPAANVDFSADGKEFEGVDLTATPTEKTTDYVNFVPTLGKTTVTGDPENILMMTTEGKLVHPSALGDMKGFRGYFVMHEAAGARAFVINFGEGETTGIQPIRMENGTTPAEGTYDLSGRRIQGQPTQKGVYIQNGKKVVIK